MLTFYRCKIQTSPFWSYVSYKVRPTSSSRGINIGDVPLLYNQFDFVLNLSCVFFNLPFRFSLDTYGASMLLFSCSTLLWISHYLLLCHFNPILMSCGYRVKFFLTANARLRHRSKNRPCINTLFKALRYLLLEHRHDNMYTSFSTSVGTPGTIGNIHWTTPSWYTTQQSKMDSPNTFVLVPFALLCLSFILISAFCCYSETVALWCKKCHIFDGHKPSATDN